MLSSRVSPSPPLLLLLLGCQLSAADSGAEQIHLAFTAEVTAVQVTYSTFQPVTPTAKYGKETPEALVSLTPTSGGEALPMFFL